VSKILMGNLAEKGESVESRELSRLRNFFGEYSADRVKEQKEVWSRPIRDVNNLLPDPIDSGLVHVAIYRWSGPASPDKSELIRILEQFPDTKQEIQDFSQWMLLEGGRGGVVLYRGARSLEDAGLALGPWVSLTEDVEIASSAFASSWFGDGFVIGVRVPVGNVFTFYEAHPGFQAHLPEKEFILNEKGLEGAELVSINGHEPLPNELKRLKGVA